MVCEDTREAVEEQLDIWRDATDSVGWRVSRKKTEYLPPHTDDGHEVRLGKLQTVTSFK